MLLLSYVGICILGLFILGYGITYWISRKDRTPVSFLLSPAIAAAGLVWCGWHLRWITHLGTDDYATVLIWTLLIASWGPILLLKKHRAEFSKWFFGWFKGTKQGVNLIAACCVTIGLSMLALNLKTLGPISIGNNDLGQYAAIERYLKEMPQDCTTGFICNNEMNRNFVEKEYFGAVYLGAFVASSLGLEIYQSQTILLLVIAFLISYFSFAYCRNTLKLSSLYSLELTLLANLHPILFYTLYHGYKGQLTSIVFTVPYFILTEYLYRPETLKNKLPLMIPTVLMSWGISLSYPHMMPIVFFIIGSLWIVRILVRNRLKETTAELKVAGKFFVTLLLGLAALSISRFILPFLFFVEIHHRVTGWYVPLFSLAQMFGMFYPLSDPTQVLPSNLKILWSLPYLAFVLLGCVTVYRKGKEELSAWFVLNLILFSGYFYFAYTEMFPYKMPDWGGYKFFKWFGIFLPIWIPLLSQSLTGFQSPKLKKLAEILVIPLVYLGIYSTFFLVDARTPAPYHQVLTQEDIELSRVEQDPRVDSINIYETSVWRKLWEIVLLEKKDLYWDIKTYYEATGLKGNWNLEQANIPSPPAANSSSINANAEVIPINSFFRLRKAYSAVIDKTPGKNKDRRDL